MGLHLSVSRVLSAVLLATRRELVKTSAEVSFNCKRGTPHLD